LTLTHKFQELKMSSPTPLGGDACPFFAPWFGLAGAAAAMILSSLWGFFSFGMTCQLIRGLCRGAAFGTAKAGIGIAGVGQFRPDL
jgi:V-type H+-transporting ATPase proteolipid subunit